MNVISVRRVGFVLVLLLTTAAPFPVNAAQVAPVSACPTDEVVQATDLPSVVDLDVCPLLGRSIAFEGTTIAVPPPGTEAEVEALGPSVIVNLKIDVDASGLASIATSKEIVEEGAEEGGGTGQAPCEWGGKSNVPNRVNGEWRYFTNVLLRPTHMTAEQAWLGLKSGFDIILTSRNDCGLPDNMALTATRVGDSSRFINSQDGVNMVGYGDVPRAGYYAEAYLYSANGVRTEADVLVDSIDYRMVTEITANCGASVHLPSIMAHEIGHVYGMQHQVSPSGGYQTMWATTPRCSANWSTLGRGDWNTLNDNY